MDGTGEFLDTFWSHIATLVSEAGHTYPEFDALSRDWYGVRLNPLTCLRTAVIPSPEMFEAIVSELPIEMSEVVGMLGIEEEWGRRIDSRGCLDCVVPSKCIGKGGCGLEVERSASDLLNLHGEACPVCGGVLEGCRRGHPLCIYYGKPKTEEWVSSLRKRTRDHPVRLRKRIESRKRREKKKALCEKEGGSDD